MHVILSHIERDKRPRQRERKGGTHKKHIERKLQTKVFQESSCKAHTTNYRLMTSIEN